MPVVSVIPQCVVICYGCTQTVNTPVPTFEGLRVMFSPSSESSSVVISGHVGLGPVAQHAYKDERLG